MTAFNGEWAEPVVGELAMLRAWRVTTNAAGEGRLRSLMLPKAWPVGGDVEAECHRAEAFGLPVSLGRILGPHRQREPLPQSKCSCGIWAVSSLRTLVGAVGAVSMSTHAVGWVQLWGRIVVGERGVRAQFARPLALLSTEGVREALEEDFSPLFVKLTEPHGMHHALSHAELAGVAKSYSIPIARRLEDVETSALSELWEV